jgi:hypothetical protein
LEIAAEDAERAGLKVEPRLFRVKPRPQNPAPERFARFSMKTGPTTPNGALIFNKPLHLVLALHPTAL